MGLEAITLNSNWTISFVVDIQLCVVLEFCKWLGVLVSIRDDISPEGFVCSGDASMSLSAAVLFSTPLTALADASASHELLSSGKLANWRKNCQVALSLSLMRSATLSTAEIADVAVLCSSEDSWLERACKAPGASLSNQWGLYGGSDSASSNTIGASTLVGAKAAGLGTVDGVCGALEALISGVPSRISGMSGH